MLLAATAAAVAAPLLTAWICKPCAVVATAGVPSIPHCSKATVHPRRRCFTAMVVVGVNDQALVVAAADVLCKQTHVVGVITGS